MLESIWYQTLEQLNDSLPEAKTMWLDYVTFKKEEGNTVYLECDSAMTKVNFEKSCMTEARNLMEELSGNKVAFDVTIASDESTTEGDSEEIPQEIPSNQKIRKSLLNRIYIRQLHSMRKHNLCL